MWGNVRWDLCLWHNLKTVKYCVGSNHRILLWVNSRVKDIQSSTPCRIDPGDESQSVPTLDPQLCRCKKRPQTSNPRRRYTYTKVSQVKELRPPDSRDKRTIDSRSPVRVWVLRRTSKNSVPWSDAVPVFLLVRKVRRYYRQMYRYCIGAFTARVVETV